MSGTQIAMLIAMAVYLFAMMGVGIKLSEKNETMGDFYLGGRKLGPLVTAMSAEASGSLTSQTMKSMVAC